jgi:hypothetical protein
MEGSWSMDEDILGLIPTSSGEPRRVACGCCNSSRQAVLNMGRQ